MNRLQSLLQMTLDFFDPAPAPVQAQPPAPTRAPGEIVEGLEEKGPLGLADNAQKAPKLVVEKVGGAAASFHAEPLQDVMAPANFRHPRANRESRLRDALVAYEFKRARRRTIGFQVGPEGLVVSAPKWVPLYDVESALQEKAAWVLKKLDETRERKLQLDANRIEWRDGTSLPFLGEQVIVVLDPRHAFGPVGAMLHTDEGAPNLTLAGVPRLTLHVALAHNASAEQIRDAVQAWLMRQAKRVFLERLDHFAPLLGVRWKKLALSSAGTRWGSASADGSIRLNWRLIHFNPSVIDYVVAHELSHLRVMDHSPRFWDTVATVLPDYAHLRHQLKDDALPRWN